MVSPKSSVPGATTHICQKKADMGDHRVLRWAVLVAGCALLIPTTIHAQSITTRDENGRKVYVNDDVPTVTVRGKAVPAVRVVRYAYWSSKEHRWKPVPA